jgi:hypothetical protein
VLGWWSEGDESVNLKLDLFTAVNNKALKVIFYLIVGFLGLVLILVGGAFWAADPLNLRAPKDQKLIAIFHAHRAAFEKLQQMAIEDARHGRYFEPSGLETVELEGRKFVYHHEIGGVRWQEYKNLLSEFRPSLDWVIDGHFDVVKAVFAGGGLLAIGPGWVKGIEYVPSSFEIDGVTYVQGWQGQILTNLDNARTLPANMYLRQIEPKWFVYYERFD